MSVEPGPVRRVVVGDDEKGRSTIIWDGPGLMAGTGMGGGRIHTDFWIWNEAGPPLGGASDAAELGYVFPGPPHGGHLRIVQGRGRPADFSRASDPAAEPLHDPVPENDGRIWSRGGRDSYSSHMHKTQTIDYAVLLDGGRELELDDETVRLYPGDFVVDVGAWHQWHTPPEGSSMSFDMFAAEFPDGADGLLQGDDPVMAGAASLTLEGGVKPPRRVVVGDVARAKPALISDGPSPDNHLDPARPGFVASRMWQTETAPAPLRRETLHLAHSLVAPKGGSLFRALTVPPDSAWSGRVGEAQVRRWFAAMNAPEASAWSAEAPHPYMQKWPALDFYLMVKGTGVLVLDTEEVTMRQGEVVVVRGNAHAWSNRTETACVIAQCSHDAR